MFIYKVKENCNLTVQGRKRFFRKNEEVEESAYTKAFPKYFKKIGEIEIKKPHQAIIMKPISTRKDDAIETFIKKEKILKEDENFKEVNNVEEIVDTYKESEQVNKQKTQQNKSIKQKTLIAKEQKEKQDQKQFQEIEELVDTFESPIISDTFLSQE